MSATPSLAQPVSIGATETAPAVSPAEIDASCRGPVMLLFLSAAGWLLAASALGLIASLNFHKPSLFADHSWLTYGRVHPGASNALVYGFAMQAGLGVILWLVCQLGRTRLAAPVLATAGWLLWNLGVTAGILGILSGESTGFEWLEMPRYASVLLFIAYLGIGLSGMTSFHQRNERQLHISQWFLLAALFWFPWIYSSANLLLVVWPVRGTLQAVVDWWYAGNLTTIWFGFIGLATAFYFVPQLTGRSLHSHYLGIFAFWLLIIFGSWGGVPAAAPVPRWLPALSSFAALLAVVAILAAALNVQRTLSGQFTKVRGNLPLSFIAFGAVAYLVSGLMNSLTSPAAVSEVTNFTWFLPAQTQLFLYGFFAMTMFGAMYYIIPRLTGAELPSPGFIRWHLRLAVLGILLYSVPLAICGIVQGFALNNAQLPFLDVVKSTLPFLRASTMGDLFMALGHLVLFLNLIGLLVRLGRGCVAAVIAMNTSTKPAGVAS